MKHNKHSKKIIEQEDNDEEINIDLTKVKEATKKAYASVVNFTNKKNSKIIIAWALIMLVIFVSTWYRVYPTTLPITEDWVRSSIENNVKNQFVNEQRQSQPTLPEATLRANAERSYQEYYKANKAQIEQQVKDNAVNFKAQLQDDKGQTYLIAIDPYLWYSYAKWKDKEGFYGNEIVDGKEMFTLRNGRIGERSTVQIPSMVILWVHNVLKIFNPDQDVFSSAFLLPVILIGLAVIPAFFLGRKLGGNIGGFFAAIIFVLSPTILGRTTAGFSDTDAYTFIFPFLIMWLFLEAIEAKTTTNRTIFSVLTGLSMTGFIYMWVGWWFTFDIIIGMAFVTIAYEAIKLYLKHNKNISKIKIKEFVPAISFLIIFLVSTIAFSLIIAGPTQRDAGSVFQSIITAPLEPINFIIGFKGAAEGISVGQGLNYPLWPNVLTTVAELNEGSVDGVIGGGGGKWLFYAAILGTILLLFKKKDGNNYPLYGILLVAWMASTFYAGLVGVRFIALFAPVVAFGIAGLLGSLTGERMTKTAHKMKISPSIVKIIIVCAGILFLVIPQMTTANAVAKSEVPSFDDTWYAALNTIKDSSEKAIISSWWDFGHWFEAMSERSVTFDGGDQGKRIHWIGKTLLTDDEDEALDILKMLNCGQEESYNLLIKNTQDKLKTTEIMKEIIRLNRADAKDVLENNGLTSDEANAVLDLSHCEDLIDMYYITSEDMVGKSSVWGHFGSWDFSKAYMYYKLSDIPLDAAVAEAQDVLGYSNEKAKSLYFEAQKIKTGANTEQTANNWISPWPNYVTGSPVLCEPDKNETALGCTYNINLGRQGQTDTILWRGIINLTNPEKSVLLIQAIDPNTGQALGQNSIKPNAVVIAEKQGMTTYKINESNFPYNIVVFKDSANNYGTLITHPLLSESLFTKLFFLDGMYTDHFEKVFDQRDFRGQKIVVWKVNP